MKQPFCRYCGKPIAKYTTWKRIKGQQHYCFSNTPLVVDKLPLTKAEAQKLFNQQVVAVRRCRETQGDELVDLGIDEVSLWDGESYVDIFFCNGDHARLFAYTAATAGYHMAAWEEAISSTKQEDKK